jgi:hypothetical protein
MKAALLLLMMAVAGLAQERAQLVFVGGHETDPRDHGRPVVLIAAALGVSPEVFREAFSHVTPAPGGTEPLPGQRERNKEALMKALSPYGVTNERLNQVSNYYRYSRERGDELWKATAASGYAMLRDGVVTGVVITNGGSGYTSVPVVSVAGRPGVKITVKLAFGPDLTRNGSVKELAVPIE